MRTRKEIEKETAMGSQRTIVELLLDIRELLIGIEKQG